MKKGIRDSFTKQAKSNDYLARSVYKLEALDRKYRLFTKRLGGTLIEFGISPGSWHQYYADKIPSDVFVIGVDMKPFKSAISNGIFVCHDILDITAADMARRLRGPVCGVLSDALPNLTGNRLRDQAAIECLRDHITALALALIADGGFCVIKTFQTGTLKSWRDSLCKRFERASLEKPKASRAQSPEVYFVGVNYRGGTP